MKYVLYAILLYIAYQFIFKLLIPVYLASRKLKKGFREMHNRMQQQAGQPTDNRQGDRKNPEPAAPKPAGDYIDFEEVK